jgi:hypothetical protein
MKIAFVRTPLTFASLAAAALVALPAAAATVSLHDRAQLDAALKEGPPCCVVDARPAGSRALRPLPDALVYRKGMKINPTAAVAVIADTDENALVVGEELARETKAPKVIAVKGGLPAWEAATGAGASAAGGPVTFVIPKNTCEQDAPLQTLRAAPR